MCAYSRYNQRRDYKGRRGGGIGRRGWRRGRTGRRTVRGRSKSSRGNKSRRNAHSEIYLLVLWSRHWETSVALSSTFGEPLDMSEVALALLEADGSVFTWHMHHDPSTSTHLQLFHHVYACYLLIRALSPTHVPLSFFFSAPSLPLSDASTVSPRPSLYP